MAQLLFHVTIYCLNSQLVHIDVIILPRQKFAIVTCKDENARDDSAGANS